MTGIVGRAGIVRHGLWAGAALLMLMSVPLAMAGEVIGRITAIDLPAKVIEIDKVAYTLKGGGEKLKPATDVGRYALFEIDGQTARLVRVLAHGSID